MEQRPPKIEKKLLAAQKLKGAKVHAKKREIGRGLGISAHYQNGGEAIVREVFENKGRILFRLDLLRNGKTWLCERSGFRLFRKQPAKRPEKKRKSNRRKK